MAAGIEQTEAARAVVGRRFISISPPRLNPSRLSPEVNYETCISHRDGSWLRVGRLKQLRRMICWSPRAGAESTAENPAHEGRSAAWISLPIRWGA
jgi:hypothetical protein